MALPSAESRAQRLRWLIIAGAALLLTGVFVWCHAQLRTSAWMLEAQAKPPPTANPTDQDVAEAERWFSLIASIQREESIVCILLAPIGAGALLSWLLALALTRKLRFTVRTILVATLYCALLIGVPFGVVRPRLQNPRIWMKDNNLAFGQIRPWPSSDSRRNNDDPWAYPGPNSRAESRLVDRYSILAAVVAFIAAPANAFIPYPKQRTRTALAARWS